MAPKRHSRQSVVAPTLGKILTPPSTLILSCINLPLTMHLHCLLGHLLLLLLLPHALSWTVDQGRRESFSKGLSTAGTLVTSGLVFESLPAFADGGSYLSDLSSFQDGARGIKYKILKEGEGPSPVRGQEVNTKYTLWVGGFGEDGGKQVDSNTGFLGRPLSVIVGIGRVIKGWDLTLLEMKVGEVRRIVIPSDIGYGDKGAGAAIPPKANLYFEVEITEMGPFPKLTAQQQQWVEENPL